VQQFVVFEEFELAQNQTCEFSPMTVNSRDVILGVTMLMFFAINMTEAFLLVCREHHRLRFVHSL
jgi:hypothetical protein